MCQAAYAGGREDGMPDAVDRARVAAATDASVPGPDAQRFSANGSAPGRFADVTRRHGAPGLAVLAGAQGLAPARAGFKRSGPQARPAPPAGLG